MSFNASLDVRQVLVKGTGPASAWDMMLSEAYNLPICLSGWSVGRLLSRAHYSQADLNREKVYLT